MTRAARLLSGALGLALTVYGCAPEWNAPLPLAPTPGAPCGVRGVSCRPVAATCCDEGDVCGAGRTCPVGMCCNEGRGEEIGARPPRPQRPE